MNLWLHLKCAKWIRLTRCNHWNLNEMGIFHWSRISSFWSSWINNVGWSAHCHSNPYDSLASDVICGLSIFNKEFTPYRWNNRVFGESLFTVRKNMKKSLNWFLRQTKGGHLCASNPDCIGISAKNQTKGDQGVLHQLDPWRGAHPIGFRCGLLK
jgi:hypothetical protein